MKKLLCVLLTVITCGYLYGQNETADTVAVAIEEEAGVVEVVEVLYEEVEPDAPLIFAEEMPLFIYKGCNDSKASFRSYVADSIRIPSGDCQGKVYVQFVVERDSTVGKIEILRGMRDCEGYEAEINRLFSSMPKWIPGKQGGVAARVKYVMPVEFLPKE